VFGGSLWVQGLKIASRWQDLAPVEFMPWLVAATAGGGSWLSEMFGVSGSGLDLPSALLLLKISLTALSALRFLVSSFTFSK